MCLGKLSGISTYYCFVLLLLLLLLWSLFSTLPKCCSWHSHHAGCVPRMKVSHFASKSPLNFSKTPSVWPYGHFQCTQWKKSRIFLFYLLTLRDVFLGHIWATLLKKCTELFIKSIYAITRALFTFQCTLWKKVGFFYFAADNFRPWGICF